MKTIFIAGASGLLGVPLYQFLKKKGFNVISHSFSGQGDCNVDLTLEHKVNEVLDFYSPQYIINLVALTDVELCEKSPQQAYLLNVRVTENLSQWIKHNQYKTKLIHISTDMVYDSEILSNENAINIKNMYAMTKYAGELPVIAVQGIVLRTNFFGASSVNHRISFSDWIINSFKEKHEIKLFTDIYFSPLSIETLVSNIEIVLNDFRSGTYNLGSNNGMSKAVFALELAKKIGLDTSLAELTYIDELENFTNRPRDMRMNVSLFEEVFNVSLPSLIEEIKKVGDYEIQQRN